jgi:hypothetical protein
MLFSLEDQQRDATRAKKEILAIRKTYLKIELS